MTAEPTIVLADTHGLWHRSWLKRPGTCDESTLVLWMQAAELHVDMRLPAAVRPLETASSLSALDADQLRLLATAEGFAGTTSVLDGVCTWTRLVNLQGPLQGLDTGTLQQVPAGLLETGLLDNYEELWQHVDKTLPKGRLLTHEHGQMLVLLWTAQRFSLGRGWPDRILPGKTLAERVDSALASGDTTALACAFDQEFCHGRIEGSQGIIENSTLPMRRGAVAFDATALSPAVTDIAVTKSDFSGETSMVEFHSRI